MNYRYSTSTTFLILAMILFLTMLFVSCTKQEYDIEPRTAEEIYLNIIEDTIKFKYPQGLPSSYIFVDYESDSMQRVFWTSPDSFASIVYGWSELEPVAGMSTYTRPDGTARQGVYIIPEFIGKTLKVVAFTDETAKFNARDSIFIQVQ